MGKLLRRGLLADCFIACGDGDEGVAERVPAHRALLCLRSERMSSHFRFMEGRSSEGGGDGRGGDDEGDELPTFFFPSLSPRTLRLLLSFLYTDRLEDVWNGNGQDSYTHTHMDTETLMELCVIADEFCLPHLLSLCEWELCQAEHLTSVTRAVDLFFLAEMILSASSGKRNMPCLRAQAAVVLVRRFDELPVEEEEEKEGEGDGDRIRREDVLKAALDCLMDL